MTPDAVGKAVSSALVPLVASLAPWDVLDARWRPDDEGAPMIWLRTQTEIQRVALQAQVWLTPQITVTLTRFGVPHDVTRRLRVGFTSDEAETTPSED